MSSANRLSAFALCIAVTWMTGCCVGPLACGPNACGPIALGDPCGGCGQCDGCGELYIDPWINHPPDCCDPCDTCGNYNGQSCGKCRSVFAGVRTLWGYRCDDGCDSCGEVDCGCEAAPICGPSCGGCDSCVAHDATCGIEHDASCGVEYDPSCGIEYGASCGTESFVGQGVPVAKGHVVRIITEPTEAKRINPAKPGLRPYPQDIPRIFKARPQVAAEAGNTGEF